MRLTSSYVWAIKEDQTMDGDKKEAAKLPHKDPHILLEEEELTEEELDKIAGGGGKCVGVGCMKQVSPTSLT